MANNLSREYLKLHISVMLAGLTGILGKLITMDAVFLVWYRLIFAFSLFYLILLLFKKIPKEKLFDILKLSLLGAVLGLHFLFFFASVKFANVAVGVVCYSLEGFFTAILEPIIYKKSVSINNLLYSLIAVGGICFIFQVDVSFRFGIFLGIISAILIALYTILNKVVSVGKSFRSVLFYELFGGALLLSFIIGILIFAGLTTFQLPSGSDFLYLFVLSFFCTIGLYMLQIQVLRTLSAFTVSLYGNFEPIYGILLAVIFLGEGKQLNFEFYIGMTLILLSVILQSSYQRENCLEKILK